VVNVLIPSRLTCPRLRARLEAAFSEGRLDEAIRLSRLVDEMQMEIIRKESADREVAV